MYSLGGLINGNSIRTQENLQAYEGCRVIITILDDSVESFNQSLYGVSDTKRKAAARELAGMWATHDNTDTVDDMVRDLRRGRCFDL